MAAADLDDLQLPRSVQVAGDAEELRISADDPEMFAPFYAFLLDIANRLQLDGASAREAFAGAITAWRRMLAAPTLMSRDAQIGLLGELWILERLISAGGPEVLPVWTGAQREAHDFRFDGTELEVKTTMGRSRRHIIGGAHQLMPSPNSDLFLLSMHLERAGLADGWSLGELIDRVSALLAPNTAAVASFSDQLSELGWLDSDAPYYPDRVRLRSEPAVIVVDDEFPRLQEDGLREAFGERMDRISDIRYTIDVEGLGEQFPSRNSLRSSRSGFPRMPDGANERIVRQALGLLRDGLGNQSLAESLRLAAEFEGEGAPSVEEVIEHVSDAPAGDPVRLVFHGRLRRVGRALRWRVGRRHTAPDSRAAAEDLRALLGSTPMVSRCSTGSFPHIW